MTGGGARLTDISRLFYAKSLILIMSSTNQFPRNPCQLVAAGISWFFVQKKRRCILYSYNVVAVDELLTFTPVLS
jgi:hypothetical protein